MYCLKCSEELAADMKFCTNCGTQVADGNKPNHLPDAENNNNSVDSKAGANAGTIIWGLVVTIIGIVVTVTTYQAASEEGGTYVVAYGAIIYGVITMIKGAISDRE